MDIFLLEDDEAIGIGLTYSLENEGYNVTLAKTVLEKEKGDIIVNSELGKGSIFELRFYKTIV